MDDQEQGILIRYLAKRLKRCWAELAAHQALAETLRQQGHPGVDELINIFRSDPSVREETDRRFAWLDKLLPPSETEIQEKVLREYLEKWHPKGEPN